MELSNLEIMVKIDEARKFQKLGKFLKHPSVSREHDRMHPNMCKRIRKYPNRLKPLKTFQIIYKLLQDSQNDAKLLSSVQ